MSLLIAKNQVNGKQILHIYDNSVNAEYDVTPNTKFHSSVPYLKFIAKATFTKSGSVAYDSAGTALQKYTTATIIDTSNKHVIFVGTKGTSKIYFNTCQFNFEDSSYTMKNYFTNAIGQIGIVSSSMIYCYINSSYMTVSKPGRTYDYDSIDMYVFDYSYNTTNSNEILINNTSLNIDGNNLFSAGYLIRLDSYLNPINPYDDILYVPDITAVGSYRYPVVIKNSGVAPIFYDNKLDGAPSSTYGPYTYSAYQIIGSYALGQGGVILTPNSISRNIQGANILCFGGTNHFYTKILESSLVLPSFSTFPASFGTYHAAYLPDLSSASFAIFNIMINGTIITSTITIRSESADKDYPLFCLSNANDYLYIKKVGTTLELRMSKSANLLSSTYLFARQAPVIYYKYLA